MRKKLLLLMCISAVLTGCGSISEPVEYNWNGGYCECGGEYQLTKISAQYFHYECDKCGKEVMFETLQDKSKNK